VTAVAVVLHPMLLESSKPEKKLLSCFIFGVVVAGSDVARVVVG